MSFAAKLFIAAIIALGGVALIHGLSLWNPHDWRLFAAYLLLAVPASCLKVKLPGITGTLSVTSLVLLAGIVALGIPETVAIAVACALTQCLWRARSRPRPIQVAFSVADMVLATTAAYYAYHMQVPLPFFGIPLRVMIAGSVYFLGNTVPIAVVIALTERKSFRQVWRECYGWSYPYYLVGAVIVGVFVLAGGRLDWQVCLMALPVVYVVHRSYRLYVDQLEARRRRAEQDREHAREVAALHDQTVEALGAAMVANAKMDAVFRASPLATLVLDRDGCVTSWNATAEGLFGWPAEEAIGRQLPFASGALADCIRGVIERGLRGDPVAGFEATQQRKDGTSFDAAIWTAKLEDLAGGGASVLMMVADVSDRKELEEQLRLSHKLEAVGRLAGGVAHDFNNLLTVINGYGSILAELLENNPEALDYSLEIVAAGSRAADLVAQLLAFSRKRIIQPKPIELNELVRGMERMLQRVITEDIELSTGLDPDSGWILADANQIEAVLLNLATNARDAMPDGGILSITTARIEVSATDQPPCGSSLAAGSYVRLAVKDTGHGMDGRTKQHLFEPFFTTKAVGKGTGLGLPSVYGGVQQNHGQIVVDSEVGQGATFSIYLPRVERPDLAEVPKVLAPGGGEGAETIVLVEDESAVRRMLFEALTRAGYRVWEAANGGDAIRKYGDRIEEADLLVTDIVMPVMNGLRLAEEFLGRHPNLIVIYLSGHAEDLIGGPELWRANLDLLQKPFVPDLLVQRVRKALDRASGLPDRDSG